MALYPFIVLGSKSDSQNAVMINHEMIHLRQQAELLIIPFYLWYITEYFIRLAVYRNRYKAYYSICFEREAYAMEQDIHFLKKRPFWNFLNYINPPATLG